MIHLRRIYVTHRFDGLHRWGAAPPHRSYLREHHRHMFHVKLTVDVRHEDRELEFHDVLGQLREDVDTLQLDDLGSCEQIADQLVKAMQRRYPDRRIACDVSEDGENGAVILALP